MKYKNLMSGFIVIAFILFCNGCVNEPVTVVTATDGVKISFDNQGKGDPAIIFIHGWANNKSIWKAQVSYFSQNYQVIAVDLPGYGESGNNRETWSMESFGSDVAAVINELDLDQVVVVGFSMGAPVAVEAALSAPDEVIGVVIVDDLKTVGVVYPPPMVAFIDSMMMDLVTNPAPEKLAGSFYKKNLDASYERVLAMLGDGPGKGWHESLLAYAKWNNEDCLVSLRGLQCPVSAIFTDAEPYDEESFRAVVPSFKVNVVPDVGHLIFWDNPDEFNRLLEESIQEFIK